MKVTFQIEGGSPVQIECNAGDNLLELARRSLFDAGFTKAPKIEYVDSDEPVDVVVEQYVVTS